MNKQPETTQRTKQCLMDAFWRLYSRKRIGKITIKQITQLAGYHRGTFYVYFTDVYDLLEQLEDTLLPEVDELPPLAPGPENPAFSMSSVIDMYARHSQYYAILLGENGDPAFAGKLKSSIRKKLTDSLAPQGAKDSFTMDYALEFVLSAMISVLTYWYRNGQNAPRDDIIRLIYELMTHGAVNVLA